VVGWTDGRNGHSLDPFQFIPYCTNEYSKRSPRDSAEYHSTVILSKHIHQRLQHRNNCAMDCLVSDSDSDGSSGRKGCATKAIGDITSRHPCIFIFLVTRGCACVRGCDSFGAGACRGWRRKETILRLRNKKTCCTCHVADRVLEFRPRTPGSPFWSLLSLPSFGRYPTLSL
jgi:hypothetical protein